MTILDLFRESRKVEQPSLLNLPTMSCLPKAKDTQGQQAVKSGKAAEDMIYSLLQGKGYTVVRQCAVATSIYGSILKVDFYVHGAAAFPAGLIIESKWQETAGSVDEKFPYLVENVRRYPCPAILVCGGGGARPEAISWLKAQADGDQLFAVFSFEEFLAWTMRNL